MGIEGRCGPPLAPVVLLGVLLAGCAAETPGYHGPYGAGQGNYRVGVPYEIKGVWYYPAVDYNYDKTGVASWYGEEFEGRLTANGEIFDLNQLTAAHTTLPMPSIVAVTNLENGRTLQLRVNDRGPFVDRRLIDVSRRAAQLLGFETQGTTLVEVRVLKDESIAAAEEAMHGSGQILVADAAAAVARPSAYSAIPPTPPAATAGRTQMAVQEPTAPPFALAQAPPALLTASAQQPARIVAAAPPPPPPTAHRAATAQQAAMASPDAAPARTRAPQPVSSRAYAALSRFSLIAPAEAAPLPRARMPAPTREIDAGSAPVAEKPSSPHRVAAAPSTTGGRVYIQAGTFAMRDNARRVSSRIGRFGTVEVTPASIRGVEMYRVRLGPFETTAEADRLLARVVGSGCPDARVVSN